jgi:hypothetical protein
VLVLLALALVGPPYINVNRYRSRVAGAIGRALGRDVTVSGIELKLLPRPGLVLHNFLVADEPSYGAEPMLRADSVTAYIRLTSLWRGRMEIGTLDLDNPSLNLVRRPDGHWNLQELLVHASQASPAPTGEPRPQSRPRFPYVEASSGRINFKLGNVKKPFAFTDADFALWVESDDLWGVRLEARPVRTDVNLSDTGTVKMNGRLQRAASLRDTALQLQLDYNAAPLGQLTTLVYGRDRGWRGAVHVNSALTGSPAKLSVTLDAQISDFRRYDIVSGEALRLRTHCTGNYSATDDALSDVQCESPVGPGTVQVRGSVNHWGSADYDLGITAERIPADRIIAFARHVKKDLPEDLSATGDIEGAFSVRGSQGNPPQWSGGGHAIQFALQSGVLKQDLQLGEVQFEIPQPDAAAPKNKAHPKLPLPDTPPALLLAVQPFALPLGAASPATADAQFDFENYRIHVAGPAELARLMTVAQALGVGTPGVGLAGAAQLDVEMAGTWTGFAPPVPTGKIQVRTATAELQGVSEPLMVGSAALALQGPLVNVSSFSAGFTKGGQLSGSATLPVHCTGPESCLLEFDVRAEDVSFARINQLLNPAMGQPWYHLLDIGRRHEDALVKLHARGHFVVPRLALGNVIATNLDGSVELSSGKLRIPELRADLLGGHEYGSWLADFTVSPPRFVGNGVVSKLAMAQLASAMHDNWATGPVDAKFNVSLSGLTADKLATSAAGDADFTWSNGSLRHVSLDGRGSPTSFAKMTGKLTLEGGAFALDDCKMQSAAATYLVKGTAAYDRTLSLKLERSGGTSYDVSGTLDKPTVKPIAATSAEAALR